MFQWMTALVEPARSARNSVGMRPKTSSRILPRASLCMAFAMSASDADLTSWANSLGSTDENLAGSKSDMERYLPKEEYPTCG